MVRQKGCHWTMAKLNCWEKLMATRWMMAIDWLTETPRGNLKTTGM
jgi:hypothetical protein